ncbi:chorismate lyase [Edaphovirga cremea]|uniref:chorismate lyase n=1 Tax=Edaphovirga cremea TaxID=2267246 RepID=UPI000DEF9445|nr:chorismate lyase [Edaphovirga cremea]
MSESKTSILPPIQWLDDAEPVPAEIADWLMELGSMTRRFEEHCHKVTVEPRNEYFITREQLGKDEAEQLPVSERYWLREIVLFGDGRPWLLGRTVIPQQTLTGSDQALVDLGTLPLGRYLFSGDNLTRDYIQTGKQGVFWARRSRLRLSDKPLLLTEIFLAESPLYRVQDSEE